MGRMHLRRKKKKKKLRKILFLIFLFGFGCKYVMDIVNHYKLDVSNEEFLKLILSDSSYINKYENNKYNLFDKTLTLITNLNVKEPISILKQAMHYEYTEDVFKEKDNNHIENPVKEEKKNPKVYIYSTHQLEQYSKEGYENYNITPNVMMASYILQDKLKKYNIESVVEERSVTDFLNTNGWNYASSYKVTRYFLEDVMSKNKYDLIIDLHRDALSKSASTTTIDGKSYAKVLFVVGTEYSGYQPNLELAKTLNTLINSSYPSLSRGVITKSGSGVNGIYNQDLADNIILLELGGQYNTVSEVMNTTEVVASIINNYLEGL